jgi:hypothetical protein
MSQYKDDVVAAETVYFWFAANLTTGAAGDGATPLYDVRLAGGAAGDAPTASGTPTLLTHANYTDGLHEIAVDTTGYANGEYAVFCTLTISTVNPAGFVGSFRVRTANRIDGLVTAVADLPTNAELATALGTADDAVLAAINDLPTNSELATALGTADDAVIAAIGALNNLSQADIRAAVGLGSANLDTQLADLPTNAELATALGTADDAVLAAINDLPTNSELATALGTADDAVLLAIAALKNFDPDTDVVAHVTLVDTTTTNTDMRGTNNAATATNLATTDGKVDDIKAKTDSLTFTKTGEVDANVQSINGTTVNGDGSSIPWGP